MMEQLWFIPAILSVFGGVQQYNAGKELDALADQQALQAQENAQLEKRELDENVRRQELADARIKGSARAKAAASGARLEGSVGDYLDFIDSEQGRQLDWMKSAGASRIRLNEQAGLLQAQATRISAKGQKAGLITGLIQGFSYAGQGGLFGKTT